MREKREEWQQRKHSVRHGSLTRRRSTPVWETPPLFSISSSLLLLKTMRHQQFCPDGFKRVSMSLTRNQATLPIEGFGVGIGDLVVKVVENLGLPIGHSREKTLQCSEYASVASSGCS